MTLSEHKSQQLVWCTRTPFSLMSKRRGLKQQTAGREKAGGRGWEAVRGDESSTKQSRVRAEVHCAMLFKSVALTWITYNYLESLFLGINQIIITDCGCRSNIRVHVVIINEGESRSINSIVIAAPL